MEFRVLQYFLAATREQSISGAAESLHLSQPTLSRQLKELEDELGKQLFIRSNRRITLTEEGMILRKRAEEIAQLVQRTEDEISQASDAITGDLFIGAGETDGVRFLAKAQKHLRSQYPQVSFHIQSGDKATILEDLDKGLIDFGLLFGAVDTDKYHFITVPTRDHWGVLMKKDSPLAKKEQITAEDLWDKPLLLSRQEHIDHSLLTWFKKDFKQLEIIGTYNLLYNASIMVDEGLGYAVCFDNIINVSGDSPLCFRPLFPRLEAEMHIIWKKYQMLSKAAEKFLEKIQEMV